MSSNEASTTDGIGKEEQQNKKDGITICGMPLHWFLILLVGVLVAIQMGLIQNNMMGAYTVALVLGISLNWIGDRIPFFCDYGGGSILAVLVPAVCIYFGILPAYLQKVSANFFTGYDFTSILIPGLLIGSILAMDRKTLLSAGLRFIIPMVGTIVLSTLVMGCIGKLVGYGFFETALYITGPILGAGVGGAAVPLAGMFAEMSNTTADAYLTTLTASVMIANVLTIVTAAVLTSIGRKYPRLFGLDFTGGGKLLRKDKKSGLTEEQEEALVADSNSTSFSQLQSGFFLACGFYAFSRILGSLIPMVHVYVWMILLAIVCKTFSLTTPAMEKASGEWTRFFSKVMIPVVLGSISLGLLNLSTVISLFSDIQYLTLCVLSVVVIVIISGALTYLFGFFLMEGSIMCGLGLADMGGSGDVAVLSACNRMELLPFLTICSRIGAGVVLVWVPYLASFFY
jgi:Na+/citrate or Na+/malate symporter